MRVENKYVMVINSLDECIISHFIKSANIETKQEMRVYNSLDEVDYSVLDVLKNEEIAEENKIYNVNGNAVILNYEETI